MCNQPLQKRSNMRRTWNAWAGYREVKRQELHSSSNTGLTLWEAPSPQRDSGYFEAVRERPARPMNVESDFITPLFQSLGIGVFVSLVGLYLAWYNGVAWHLACFGGVAAAGLFFLVALLVNRKLLWIAERIIREDLDGDGATGPPPPQLSPPPPLEVLHRDESGSLKTMYRLQLPDGMTDEKLREFAKGALVKGLSHGIWTGRVGLFSSRSEFEGLMAELERSGIVIWVDPANHNAGRQLTQAGKSALRHWSQQPALRPQEGTNGSALSQTNGAQESNIGKFEVIE